MKGVVLNTKHNNEVINIKTEMHRLALTYKMTCGALNIQLIS